MKDGFFAFEVASRLTVTTCPLPANNRRTRTPSDLKLLLNERAAAAGEVRALEVACREFEGRLVKLERAAGQIREHLQHVRTVQAAHQAQVDALDLVMHHGYPNIDPARVSAVNAWAGKYGTRGDLKKFILQFIRDAHPGAVSTSYLRAAIVAHFGLQLGTKRQADSIRFSLKEQLARSRAEGVIDSRPAGSRRALLWFWCDGSPSAAQLFAAAARSRNDEEPHIFRGEMGG